MEQRPSIVSMNGAGEGKTTQTMKPSTGNASPRRSTGAALCVAVTTDGTTVYANRAAFQSLAKWMEWISKSDPSEHFELHVLWHLTNHSQSRPNAWLLFDKEMRRIFVRRATGPDSGGPFELTFMHATKKDLDGFRRRSASEPESKALGQVRATAKKAGGSRRPKAAQRKSIGRKARRGSR